jgi:hypothetical protein
MLSQCFLQVQSRTLGAIILTTVPARILLSREMSSEKKRASDGEVATEEGKKAKKGEAVEKVYDLGRH